MKKNFGWKKKKFWKWKLLKIAWATQKSHWGGVLPRTDRPLDDITEWLLEPLLASSKVRLKTRGIRKTISTCTEGHSLLHSVAHTSYCIYSLETVLKFHIRHATAPKKLTVFAKVVTQGVLFLEEPLETTADHQAIFCSRKDSNQFHEARYMVVNAHFFFCSLKPFFFVQEGSFEEKFGVQHNGGRITVLNVLSKKQNKHLLGFF